MTTEIEVREELERLFPGESNDAKISEWLALANDGLVVAAENRIRKWRIEVERNRTNVLEEAKRQNKSAINYTELTESLLPTGIKVRGFADIGRILSESDVISLDAIELVDTDSKFATYAVRIVLSKDDREYGSTVQYEEISKLLNAIQAMKRVNSGVTEFAGFQVDWMGDGDFSISVFSDSQGRIMGSIKSNGTAIYLNTLEAFDELEKLLIKAKSYIDSHLQCVGKVDFVTINEARRKQAEFLSELPELIIEAAAPFMQILSKKFLQLTYVDDYGTREYGSFFSEIDRFISKIIPTLGDDHRGIARDIIASTVATFTVDQEKNGVGFDANMSSLEYEQHCANAFSLAGWTTNMTPKTGDQGADVVIKTNDLTGVVQCKLYNQPVGNAAVQEIIAAREYYQASIAIVVSNANYTTAARQLAAMANVVLLHHGEIAAHSRNLGVEQLVEPVTEM